MSLTVQVNDLRLSYAEWPGEKGPLICLPSLTAHKGSFASLAQALAPAYRVLALDLRGRGDSDKPAEGYGFAYHARDILSFADALGLDSFFLVGHSFGATVGVYLASIRPRRVRAIVLLDGGADPKDEVMEAMRPAIHHLDRVYPSMEVYLAAMRAIPYFRPWNATLERYLREDVQALPDGRVRSKTSAEAVGRDLDIHFSYSMCLHFPNLRCPTLFIRPEQGLNGERGHVFSPGEAAAIVAWIPDCRRVDAPGVNHYTLLLHDAPPIAEPIRAFLDELS
jgi:pimeloyl-ACP methyl ester carboxylesterase